MKLNIYAYYNKALGAFDTKLQLDDHDDRQVVYGVSRGLKARLVLNTYQDLKFLAFYKLGTFDDETGEFVADKNLLLDFDREISLYESKGEEKDGNDTKNN